MALKFDVDENFLTFVTKVARELRQAGAEGETPVVPVDLGTAALFLCLDWDPTVRLGRLSEAPGSAPYREVFTAGISGAEAVAVTWVGEWSAGRTVVAYHVDRALAQTILTLLLALAPLYFGDEFRECPTSTEVVRGEG